MNTDKYVSVLAYDLDSFNIHVWYNIYNNE